MTHERLFSNANLGEITLKNRVVMAPMTRCRAVDNAPTELVAEYYGQRADAGLLITEGVAPSRNGLGYARTPGAYSAAQVEGWKLVTSAVHAKGGRIFMQLMHVGRMGHPDNQPEGAQLVAPSAIAAKGQMYTDEGGMQDQPVPVALSAAGVEAAIQEFVDAATNAIAAGMDGVEIHGANGYLIEQFLSGSTNQRTDDFGGSAANRSRFALEVAKRTANAIGAGRVGIRLSPFGAAGDMAPYDGQHDQYVELARQLGELGLVYLHTVDHSSMGAPPVPQETIDAMRVAFNGTFMTCGGYDADGAENALSEDQTDLVAFGRPFISNPDLVVRMKTGAELNPPNFDTFYTPGPAGYTDYAAL